MIFNNIREDVNGNVYILTQDGSGNAISSTAGALNVFVTGGSSSGTVVDKSTFVYGTGTEMPVGGVYNDTAPTLSSGTSGVLRLTTNRGLHINLRDSSGVERGITGIGNTVYVTQQDALGNTAVYTAAGEMTVKVTQPLPAGTNVIGSVNQGTSPWVTLDTNSGLINGKLSPATATMTQPTVSTTTASVLASNAARKGVILYNKTNVPITFALGTTASLTVASFVLFPNSMDQETLGTYTGAVSAITAAAVTGTLFVTELT
jgi:hypothetical protein